MMLLLGVIMVMLVHNNAAYQTVLLQVEIIMSMKIVAMVLQILD